MSKQLLIIRHAKSDWEDRSLKDFDRPLNKRGHRDAPEMAGRLLKKYIIPQLLVSSPAKRALTTARYFAETLNFDKKEIQLEEGIYEASSTALITIINKLNNRYDVIAIFGHNPGLSDLVSKLSGDSNFNIPTCGMVLIKFPFDDWEMAGSGTGEVQFFDYPKNIAENL
jgi:phosphohistidine phosphatase